MGGNITHCQKIQIRQVRILFATPILRKDMSKGSKQRPTDKDKFNNGWDRIFGKKKEDKKDDKKS